MERENGYYWVRQSKDESWEPAYWDGQGQWQCIGYEDSFTYAEFYEINETEIKVL
jgi:hypothetical protein